MKKILIIFCVFFLLFVSACENTKPTEDDTTVSTTAEETLADNVETESKDETIQTTKKQKEPLTELNKTEKTSQQNQNNVPPYILSVNLNDLTQIKSATESMNEADFIKYMDNNFPNEVMNGMVNLSQTKKFLSELEESYIPLLDGNESNFSTISFYPENNEFHQLTYFGEKSRIVAYIHTSKNIEQSEIMLNNIENATIIKDIETDTYSAKVYVTENNKHYFVDLFVDESYIFLRTHDITTIEEFEECFNRLTFVKIGDLLNG